MPIATVAAIVTKEGHPEEVLLTRRNIPPFRGQWCLPGGHIERHEPAREAIIREVKEEVGLDFDARFFAYFDEIIPELDIHAVVLAFQGLGRGELRPHRAEVEETKWLSLKAARSLALAFTHNEILDAYAAQGVPR
jgi:8-oxo-dGTP diphosphatase